MVAKRVTPANAKEPSKARRPPATTPEGREQQLVGYAVELAEKQIRDGTVSAQVLTHFLKIASGREALERKKLEQENELLKAKVQQIGSGEEIKELYSNALAAMRSYSGQEVDGEYDD